MSNLNSIFDTLRGWPDGSALEASFDPEYASTIVEGTVVKVSSRELSPAKVLRIKDSSLVTAPTLVVADRGKAYVVAGLGGAWSTFAIGDIVEWDGTAWHQIVAGVESEVPTGTRVVVVEASAAGAFAGHEEKVLQYTKTTAAITCKAAGYTPAVAGDISKVVLGGTSGHTAHLVSYDNGTKIWIVDPVVPAQTFHTDETLTIVTGTGIGDVQSQTPAGGAWAATVPVNGNRIKIVGANSIYENKFYDYIGTHATGVWGKAALQKEAPALISALVSAAKAGNQKDQAWIVIRGNDQFDGKFTNKLTCLKCQSGFVVKMACIIADTLVPGDLVAADTGGVLQKLTSGAGMEWPIGQVLQSNGVSGATGWVVIATY